MMKAMLTHLDKLHVAIAFSSQDHHVGVWVVKGDQDSRRHVQIQLVLIIMKMVMKLVMVMKLMMVMQKGW